MSRQGNTRAGTGSVQAQRTQPTIKLRLNTTALLTEKSWHWVGDLRVNAGTGRRRAALDGALPVVDLDVCCLQRQCHDVRRERHDHGE